jgi:hypothetical protein
MPIAKVHAAVKTGWAARDQLAEVGAHYAVSSVMRRSV